MLIKLLDLITVEHATGAEYDISELVTYLNDAVLIAPSMLLAPDVSWVPVEASSFDVSLVDYDRTVTARVFVDEKGAPRDFSTTDRFCYNPNAPKQLMRASSQVGPHPLPDGRKSMDVPCPLAPRRCGTFHKGRFPMQTSA
jgi:hypothetical protein